MKTLALIILSVWLCLPALAQEPADAEGFYSRGMASARKGETRKALADFTEAIRLDPKHVAAYVNRGYLEAQTGEHTKALKDYDEALRLDAKNPAAYYNRGYSHYARREYEDAIADFTEVLRLHPGHAEACTRLAWILATCPQADLRDGKMAVNFAQAACQLSKWKFRAAVDALAAAYAEAGDFENAVKYEKEFLEKYNPPERAAAGAAARLKLYEAKTPHHEK
jgi:tetratricopeptide (TPR) repeat protein